MDNELKKNPLFLKAEEIYNLVLKVSALVEEKSDKKDLENIILNDFKNSLNKSALMIPGKIAVAYKEDMLYDVKMQNAAIIRSEAHSILSSISGLKMCGFKEHDYLDLIRNEIDAFRILFAEWVQTFDESNYVIDRWGLFNPPGINYDDFDIDDELPYDDPFDDEDYDPPGNDFDDFDINDDFNNGFDDED
tara:strand:- start:2018 stop:2590 length:573 start_codon:yes stop_codon:yes gene_type:complete